MQFTTANNGLLTNGTTGGLISGFGNNAVGSFSNGSMPAPVIAAGGGGSPLLSTALGTGVLNTTPTATPVQTTNGGQLANVNTNPILPNTVIGTGGTMAPGATTVPAPAAAAAVPFYKKPVYIAAAAVLLLAVILFFVFKK